jgi:hypothetical protein
MRELHIERGVMHAWESLAEVLTLLIGTSTGNEVWIKLFLERDVNSWWICYEDCCIT